MTARVSSTQRVVASPTFSLIVQHGAALLFGALILFAVGFMPMGAMHNAAHDTRHALAFPCH